MRCCAILLFALLLFACESFRPRSPVSAGPGVFRASAFTCVKPRDAGVPGWITFPIPGLHGGQIPLTFDLIADPWESLLGFQWRLREDGLNWVCEVHVLPPAGGATIRWESLVLLPDHPSPDLRPSKQPEAPGDAARWLRSTACVQSDDPAILAKAGEIAGKETDLIRYVKAVLDFTARNQGKPGVEYDSLDARKALDCGGTCTSRANLAAALLRARGIPARTQAHLPTWWTGGYLYEHWLVEYWHPGVGWVWIEPTLGRMQPPNWSVVVLNVANPEDEDRAFEPAMKHSGIMPGAPALSVHKHSEELLKDIESMSETLEDEGSFARIVLSIKDKDDRVHTLYNVASFAFETLKEISLAGKLDRSRTMSVEAAIRSKELETLLRALKK